MSASNVEGSYVFESGSSDFGSFEDLLGFVEEGDDRSDEARRTDRAEDDDEDGDLAKEGRRPTRIQCFAALLVKGRTILRLKP